MNELTVFSRHGQLYTDSRDVAKMIGKEHKHLLRDIDGYISILGQSKIGLSDFFIRSTYTSSQNKQLPCYLITKKGCEFVANKLTGEKGVIFTAAYVNAFHTMEDKLIGKSFRKKSLPLASVNHMLEINIRQMKAANQPAEQIALWTNGITREALAPFGIDVPVLPSPVVRSYDATEIAKKIGVLSKSGNPHAQAVTAIIKAAGIAPDETFTTETTAHSGTKNVPDVRYKAPVLDRVRDWLEGHDFPNPISLGGKNYNVVYDNA
jgi:Rha family phage regulatory protein